MITLTDSQISDRQDLASGPASDGTSLFVLSGVAATNLSAYANAGQQTVSKESYRLLVGPTLPGPVRAIAGASAASVTTSGEAQQAVWSVRAIEADLDDESGRVQLLFEVEARVVAPAANPTYLTVTAVAFQVTIHGTPAT